MSITLRLAGWACVLGLAILTMLAVVEIAKGDYTRVIYVINNSPVTNQQLEDAFPAFEQQANEDLAPVWATPGVKFQLVTHAPDDAWAIVVNKFTDLDGAAGYHSLAGKVPYAIVGTGYKGLPWQQVFSHELVEMLVDPFVERASYSWECIPYGPCTSRKIWAVEVADPVEHLHYSYNRKSATGLNVILSDFVYPAWYTGQGGGKLDHLGWVKHAHKTLYGGYAYVFREGEWHGLGLAAFKIHPER